MRRRTQESWAFWISSRTPTFLLEYRCSARTFSRPGRCRSNLCLALNERISRKDAARAAPSLCEARAQVARGGEGFFGLAYFAPPGRGTMREVIARRR